MSFRLKDGKYNILWPICILKYCLPIICFTFFGQFFLLLISIFICKSDKTYYDDRVPCRRYKYFYLCAPTSIIGIIIQIILSYITISMYFIPDFINRGNDLLKKRTSTPELIFLFCKIIIIIIFTFDKESENEHWGILFILCLITGINAYAALFLQNYENIIIKRFNSFYSLFLFWGFACLFILKIFKNWEIGGGLYLFLLGLILIFFYCIYYMKTYADFLNLNYNEINNSTIFLDYIKAFLQIAKQRKDTRDNSIVLASLIQKIEERCNNNKCILKKYLECLSNGFDSNFLLLLFAQKLFKIAIIKFPNDVLLRFNYIVFLSTQINQKKNALKELILIKQSFVFLNNNFNLYFCKKYIEEYNSINSVDQEEEEDNNDIFQAMEYKSNIKEFRKLLSKVSSLYYEFWSSLYSSHLQGTEDFKKLNDLGADLNILIEDIEKIFEKLCKIKKNDYTIFKLYESYVKNILNDKEKYEKYYNFSKNLTNDNNVTNRVIDYTNYDLKILNKTDEYRYLIISANDNNRGIIMNMSLNLCVTFGYHKDEIIGKNMNILIPEIYQKNHDKLFNDKTENIKTEFFENLTKKINYKPNILEFSGFGKNKSRYLIPLDFKIFFIQTEESDLAYMVDIIHHNISNVDFDDYSKDDNSQIYCVLTDNNLIIQTFTPNCVEHLGLNSDVICSNYDITNFIKEFNDELVTIITTSNKELSIFEMSEVRSNDNSFREANNNSINNINDDSFEKLRLKKKLLKSKFLLPRKIIWNNNIKEMQDKEFYSGIGKTQVSLFCPNNKKNSLSISINEFDFNKNINSKKNFIMSVKKALISGRHIGYYFFLKKLKIPNENENNFLEKNKTLNTPQTKIKNLKRPSIKHFKLDEDQSLTNRKNNNDHDENSILHKNSLKLTHGEKKRHSVNFDLDNMKQLRKHESAKILSEIDDMIDLNDKYIPKCNLNFVLDLESMSYKPSWRIDSLKKLNNDLRQKTISKINLLHQTQKKSSDDSSEIDNSSNDSNASENYTSSYTSSSINSSPKDNYISSTNDNNNIFRRNNNRKASIIENNIFSHINVNINDNGRNDNFQKKNNIKKNNSNDEYYRINLSKIKLMIYDFTQEVIIASDEKDKKSKVEKVIEEYKSHQNINISEDINFSFISFHKKEPKNKNSKNKKNNKEKKNTEEEDKIKKIFDREREFEQEIKYALSKQDEQKSIHHFYKISVIFFVIMLIMSTFEIYYIIVQYLNLKENMNLILQATSLKYLTNIGIYFIRENTLINIENQITDGLFNIPDKNNEYYRDLILNFTQNIFTECNNILESITSSNLIFCYDTNKILTEPVFEIEELYNENYIKKYNTTLYVLMIQVYSAFCNLISKSEYITVDDRNLFNFIHNSHNSLGYALNKQLELFFNELGVREKSMLNNIILNTFVFLVLHIIVYFLISGSYCLIVKRKASYIEVFYGIGISLIKTSIKKCEIFINKIYQNDDIEKQRDVEEDESSFMTSSNFNNNIFSDINFDKKRVIKKNGNNNNKKKRILGNDKQSIKFRLILQIAMLISYLYLISVFYSFLSVSKAFIYSGNYILHMQKYHNNIIELFNGYREFLFDENSIIYGLSAYDYLIQKEKIIYSSNTEDINYLKYFSENIKGLNKNFFVLLENGFCYYFESFFESREGCENFIGGKDGMISMDFHLFVNSFIEEVRNARDFMKLLLDKQVLVGNLSELIENKENDSTYGIDKNKTLMFRMKVFNMEETHYRLNIIFFNILYQYINQIRIITINSIEEHVTNMHMSYIVLILSYIFIFILIYFFYWIPMIRNLDVEIYKTKNMLSIIPVKILASQPNIKKLLNISSTANE